MPMVYLSGMNREECVAPIPGLPCLTGLLQYWLASTHNIAYPCMALILTMRC